MSRFTLDIPDTSYQAVYGVDHVTSTFLMIQDASCRGDSFAAQPFSVNNRGVHFEPDALDENQLEMANRLKHRFEHARDSGNPYPNLHAEELFEALRVFGLELTEEVRRSIYAQLDEPA